MVTRVYESFTPIDPFSGSPGLGQVVAPPGVVMPAGSGFELFDNLIGELGLPVLGTFTPWAAREGEWLVVRQPPETNVLVAGLSDEGLAAAQSLGFGTQLPWIAIYSENLPSEAEVAAAFGDTAYELFHTQAVYDQADPGEPPVIRFLHWGRLRNQVETMAAHKQLEQAAAQLAGRLVFAAQVNYDTTRQREPPATPFESAFGTQFGIPAVTPAPTPTPSPTPQPVAPEQPLPTLPPAPPAQSWKPFLVPMAATALLFGVGGFCIVRYLRTRSRA
jgi:hypothetical protein